MASRRHGLVAAVGHPHPVLRDLPLRIQSRCRSGYGAAISILKSFRDRFVRAISQGEVDLDPDEVVEAGSVGTTQGPIVVAQLDELGIRATTLDHRVGGNMMGARMKVMVLRRDYERAAAFINEFTREYPSHDVIDH